MLAKGIFTLRLCQVEVVLSKTPNLITNRSLLYHLLESFTLIIEDLIEDTYIKVVQARRKVYQILSLEGLKL